MNKATIIAIVTFFVTGFLIGTQIHGCNKGCSIDGYKLTKTDTLVKFVPRIDTLWHTVQVTNNIPYRVWGHDTVFAQKLLHTTGADTIWLTTYSMATDTVAYADTLKQKDEFKAEIFDTLYNNRIIGRSLRWANISPIEVKTVTNSVVKKGAIIKVYVGADASGGKSGIKYNLDLAPGASLIFADKYMLDLGYYIFNQQATAGFKVKLSFRK